MSLKCAIAHTSRWHADIKPDNILSVQGKFKLADPGFATFIPKKDGIPKEHVSGGTETYGNTTAFPITLTQSEVEA
jgi:hypothetical protein